MGRQGVKHKFNMKEVEEVLIKKKGRLSFAAKELNCCFRTLKNYIDANLNLTTLINELRYEYTESLLDAGEDTLGYAISNRDKDLTNALKATIFVCNMHGKNRGYNKSDNNLSTESDLRHLVMAFANMSKETQKQSEDNYQ